MASIITHFTHRWRVVLPALLSGGAAMTLVSLVQWLLAIHALRLGAVVGRCVKYANCHLET